MACIPRAPKKSLIHSRAPGVKDFPGRRQNALGDVWRRALTSKHRNATLCRVFSAKEEEAASTGLGAQKCSVSPSSTQSPELGHSCLVLLTQPSKASPAAHRNDVRHRRNPQCLQLAVYGALCCLSSAPDLMGSPLNQAVPKEPTARQSRGTAGASPSQQRLSSPLFQALISAPWVNCH